MSKHVVQAFVLGVLSFFVVVLIGCIWLNMQFADRIPIRTRIGLFPVGGLEASRVLTALNAYELEFSQTKATIAFRNKTIVRTFGELGITLQKEVTAKKVQAFTRRGMHVQKIQLVPEVSFSGEVALQVLQYDFADRMDIPKNATFILDADKNIRMLPTKNGEQIDMVAFQRDVLDAFSHIPMSVIIASAMQVAPQSNANELEMTRVFAESLLQTGLQFTAQDKTFHLPGQTILGMMFFTGEVVPAVQLDTSKLSAYITDHIAQGVQQDAVNARFQMNQGKVDQFALPQDGRSVHIPESAGETNRILALRQQAVPLVIQAVAPLISDTGDSEKLGIRKLLAVGETDFKGSPKNRKVNIGVGTSKYNGILIAPNEEFSFNAFLGPVNKEAGYLPELVIKNKTTTAEHGGGLCQVSTTAFRAAVFAGMEITSRRNHAYAVRYYGTPGFDATIYPPYTDFRFLNNTPGYILIQTKIEGTKLSFEFWGTDDARSVVVDGPHPYAKMPDGAVKSVLKQTVTRDGTTIVEDTFYSNYKSPSLFPHT